MRCEVLILGDRLAFHFIYTRGIVTRDLIFPLYFPSVRTRVMTSEFVSGPGKTIFSVDLKPGVPTGWRLCLPTCLLLP